jgi:hypothetical protein
MKSEIVKSETIAEFSKSELIESIAVWQDKSIYTTSFFEWKIYKIINKKSSTLLDYNWKILL